MKCFRHQLLTPLMLTFAVCSGVLASDSSHADFERFCQLMEGRWVGEVTWVADWPGLGKKGEKSVAFLTYTPTDDGQGMLVKFNGGSGSATGLAVYDAAGKEIRFQFVVSGGYVGQQIITIAGNQVTFSGIGSLPDGRRHIGRTERMFSETGRSFEDKVTGKINDQPTDEVSQTFRKVSGNFPLPKEAREFKEFGDAMSGRWLRDIVYVHDWEGAVGGRGDKARGYHHFEWINDGHALREVTVDGENRSEAIFTWDPQAKQTVAFGTSATGGMFMGKVQKVADHKWKLVPLRGGTPKGEKFGGEILYTVAPDGKRMDASGIITLDGKPLDNLQDVYHKLTP